MLNFQKLKTTKCYGVTALWRCADLSFFNIIVFFLNRQVSNPIKKGTGGSTFVVHPPHVVT